MVYLNNSRQDTLIKQKGEFIDESEQTIIASVHMMGATIEHAARNHYRPYMVMYGEISAVAFPNGRYQKLVPERTQMHIRYEFSDDEIAQLAQKGLFYDGFKCPDIIAENPNIEIPLTVNAKRYLLMNNLYVTLEMDSSKIHKTDTKDCGYIFADYFDAQVPVKLDTEEISAPQDAIPTQFDEDFAAQFAAEFKGFDEANKEADEEMAKGLLQAEHQQSLISEAAQRLLDKSPTAARQRNMAKEANEHKIEEDKTASKEQVAKEQPAKPVESKKPSLSGGILEDDDEFNIFRRAQEELSASKPVIEPFEGIDKKLAEEFGNAFADSELAASDSNGEDISTYADEKKAETKREEAETVREAAMASDASVNTTVKDIDGEDYAGMTDEPNFGDELASLFDKDSVEKAVSSVTKRHGSGPVKLQMPDSDDSMSNDFSADFGE